MSETPMLAQYRSIKEKHKDCVLLFRLGDFYEMFYDDAKLASRTLDLVLTSRGKGSSNKIPMCGVPYHAADNYIARIIKSGYKVAICEQMEDPALAKGIVRRDVIRVITAGTWLDEHNSDARYLLCLSPNEKNIGVAFTDPVSGTIQTNQYPLEYGRLAELIAKLPIYECVYPQGEETEAKIKPIFEYPLLRAKNIALSPYGEWSFNQDIAKKTLCEHFAVHNLHGFGIEDLASATSSAGALLEYLREMNKQPLKHIDRIALYNDDDYVFISPAAARGLELDTLIATLDSTLTPLGRRMFRFWLTHPLKSAPDIIERQDAIRVLSAHPEVCRQLKDLLDKVPDLEKNISRLSCGYTHAKDLLAIRNTLALLPAIQDAINPVVSRNALFDLEDIPDLRQYLERAVNDTIPLSHPEGKIIRAGYHAELDALRDLQENGRQWLKKFQENEIKRTGINSLKVGFNQIFGYYIEITRANQHLAPQDYIRKQTLVNGERYITPALKEHEEKILTAEEKIFKIENALVQEIRQEVLTHSARLHQFCQTIATLDTLYSLHVLAQSPGCIAPEIADDTLLEIKDGRHPVVERILAGSFVPNDTLLDGEENHLIVLTGPNMSGKSTYIRQTAILTIMAQMGSFIPASSAHVGIVDKIFTRIGAHDDINKGQSTFMVEMNETADILNNMTNRSLIILDEIGRGTSTYDGLSLAWAIAEHLQTTKTRTLFATHFHELTALADEKSGVRNYNVAVKEWKDEVIFLHKIIPGSTDDSYGIYVAKLAGIPKAIIGRARHILTQLELKNDLKENLKGEQAPEKQLDIFHMPVDPMAETIKETIRSMDVNSLTLLEALNKMQELKKLIEKKES
ncbi:MAG: DNA mismatch repair protein MutS [Candidatus Omnitrophica bacterium]|nr:DNA mismatch repair protein MutS [Candidatus Omnitrophota bacterium]